MLRFVDGEWVVDALAMPMSFHEYPTVVTDRILEIPYKHGDAVYQLQEKLVEMFSAKGIKCWIDNKTAFCFQNSDGRTYFIGFKDLTMSVGKSARTY